MSSVMHPSSGPRGDSGFEPWYLATTPLETRPWLIRVRWATVAIEALLLTAAFGIPELNLPLDHIAALIVADAAANAAMALLIGRARPVPGLVATLALAVQMLLITALLELTGGPSNPFVVVYALQIALAALTSGAQAAVALTVFGVSSYSVLIYWHVHELVPTHHRVNDFPTHLLTMWVAGTVAAEMVAYFVGRASEALRRREEALEDMRQRAARSERVISLTTLAAGAAHELSTPLATIALTARELEHALDARGSDVQLADDAKLIRSEVDRCQAILDQMSGRAGGSAEDAPELVVIRDVLEDVRSRLAIDSDRVVLHTQPDLVPVLVPRGGLSQTLLSLVRNACEASADTRTPVVVEVTATAAVVRVSIVDQGHGFTRDALRRAGEPFFTTKEPGRGLGLGLFLARVFAERIGGSLKLASGIGTTAVLELPVKATVPETV
jgi:two-component system sensor histidine kinase RegB